MPFCNGETVIRGIREDSLIKDTPVLVLSAHRDADLVERLSHWGLVAYILKPIKPEDLVETVRRFFTPEKPEDEDDLGDPR